MNMLAMMDEATCSAMDEWRDTGDGRERSVEVGFRAWSAYPVEVWLYEHVGDGASDVGRSGSGMASTLARAFEIALRRLDDESIDVFGLARAGFERKELDSASTVDAASHENERDGRAAE
jgi:hypothetical protein